MLNILVCSMHSRRRQLSELMSVLEPQLRANPAAEVLIETDEGEMSIGEKRNLLLKKATRKYVAFVDDDDMVAENYVALVLAATAKGEPDCVGICGYLMQNGQRGWQFRHSIQVKRWNTDKRAQTYWRTPNHLNPIKRSIASSVRFPCRSWGEDKDYSDRVRPHLHTEHFIDTPIYFYLQGNK
jgi:glycosyltransferase involved in cell wall biosynthesis